MKKKYLALFLSLATLNVMANPHILSCDSVKRELQAMKDEWKLQNEPRFLFSEPWFIVENSPYVTFKDEKFLICKDGRKNVSLNGAKTQCKGGEKELTLDQFVKTKFPKAKGIAMTPNYDRFTGKFKFAVVHYVVEGN